MLQYVIHKSDEDNLDRAKASFVAGLSDKNNMNKMHSQIKEYSTIKEIMERNSEYIRATEDS